MTTFAEGRSVRGRDWNVASLTRSMLPEVVATVDYEADPGRMPLWWGPIVEVRPGDRLVCFLTATGLAVEAVERRDGG